MFLLCWQDKQTSKRREKEIRKTVKKCVRKFMTFGTFCSIFCDYFWVGFGHRFLVFFGCQNGSKSAPKWSSGGTKTDAKNYIEICLHFETLGRDSQRVGGRPGTGSTIDIPCFVIAFGGPSYARGLQLYYFQNPKLQNLKTWKLEYLSNRIKTEDPVQPKLEN